MSFASSLELTLACSSEGLVAGWQGGNALSLEGFEEHLTALAALEESSTGEVAYGPPMVNFPSAIVSDADVGASKLALCEKFQVPIVLSSVGNPAELANIVHGWGGHIVHDVTTVAHAEKALEAGVDGLMLTCAGAGGHSGYLTPFAFIPKIRSLYAGLILAAGGIASGGGIAGALALGADIAVMGTRFIATNESGAFEGHKAMIAEAQMHDVILSDALNGLDANWIRQSIERIGWDPNDLPQKRGPRRGAELPEGVRAWRDVWSAGQSVGLIDEVLSTHDVVARLAREFSETQPQKDWHDRLGQW
jgi:nitronate monooxygenase